MNTIIILYMFIREMHIFALQKVNTVLCMDIFGGQLVSKVKRNSVNWE